jgi:hypothetical protein
MGKNTAALERTIKALAGLNSEHDALIEHARTLALTIDSLNGAPLDTKLHGEYRQVLKTLLDVGKAQEVDAFAEALRKLAERATGD